MTQEKKEKRIGFLINKVVTLNTVLIIIAMEEIYFKLIGCMYFYRRSEYVKLNLSLENTMTYIKLGLESMLKWVILFLLLKYLWAEKNCIGYRRGTQGVESWYHIESTTDMQGTEFTICTVEKRILGTMRFFSV